MLHRMRGGLLSWTFCCTGQPGWSCFFWKFSGCPWLSFFLYPTAQRESFNLSQKKKCHWWYINSVHPRKSELASSRGAEDISVQAGLGIWACTPTVPAELLVLSTAGCWEKNTSTRLPHHGFETSLDFLLKYILYFSEYKLFFLYSLAKGVIYVWILKKHQCVTVVIFRLLLLWLPFLWLTV